jgi:UDP-N-acetylglucosamine--dolichyl-phosphate N-acetylglucosaminephosphotransferase
MPAESLWPLLACLGVSALAYTLTAWLVPRLGPSFVAKGLKGIDMLKGYPRNAEGRLDGPPLCVAWLRSRAQTDC